MVLCLVLVYESGLHFRWVKGLVWHDSGFVLVFVFSLSFVVFFRFALGVDWVCLGFRVWLVVLGLVWVFETGLWFRVRVRV